MSKKRTRRELEELVEQQSETIGELYAKVGSQAGEITRLLNRVPAREGMFPNGKLGPDPDEDWFHLARHHVWIDGHQDRWTTARERRDFGISLSVGEGWDEGPMARIRFTPQPEGYADIVEMTIEDLAGFIEELQSLMTFMKRYDDLS